MVKDYKLKTKIKAVQFTGYTSCLDDLKELAGENKVRSRLDVNDSTKCKVLIYYEKFDTYIDLNENEWLIKDEDGIRIMTDKEFNDMYEEDVITIVSKDMSEFYNRWVSPTPYTYNDVNTSSPSIIADYIVNHSGGVTVDCSSSYGLQSPSYTLTCNIDPEMADAIRNASNSYNNWKNKVAEGIINSSYSDWKDSINKPKATKSSVTIPEASAKDKGLFKDSSLIKRNADLKLDLDTVEIDAKRMEDYVDSIAESLFSDDSKIYPNGV